MERREFDAQIHSSAVGGPCLLRLAPTRRRGRPGAKHHSAAAGRFGLSEAQVRGALGALLIFVRERLAKQDFDAVAKSIPNADYIMREVRLRGIVTRPLDDIVEYQVACEPRDRTAACLAVRAGLVISRRRRIRAGTKHARTRAGLNAEPAR